MKTSLLVYLFGPMTGQSYEDAVGWRRQAAEKLQEHGFTVLDPARGLMFLEPESTVKDSYGEDTTENKHTVFARDRFDSTRSDILLGNLKGATRVSIGSMMEMAWANLSNKFIVTVMEPEGNPHMHAFVRECSGAVMDSVEDAVDYIIATFKV